jgi:predicted nucleic acid-binding protein
MGKRHLIDSNVIIDFCNGKLSAAGRDLLTKKEPEISIITNIELFATKNISEQEYLLLEQFLAITTIHPLTKDLVKTTIDIRQQYKLKLPDAVIASTAVYFDMLLLTRNIADFNKIKGLQIIDPYSL